MEMIKILIADDHIIVREGLKQIISETKNLQIADEASDGFEVLEKVNKQKFDIVIMDISMPGKNGLEVLKDIKADFPKLPVLVLSMHPEEKYGIRFLRAGASGYLTKESATDELIDAINKIVNGGRYISSTLAEKLVYAIGEDSSKPSHNLLSDREYEIMLLIAQGKQVSQIASLLSLSVPTISTYRARILEKMKLKNNAEITYYALKNDLIE